jgi:formylmethanofuran dehydrogenase subunit E
MHVLEDKVFQWERWKGRGDYSNQIYNVKECNKCSSQMDHQSANGHHQPEIK